MPRGPGNSTWTIETYRDFAKATFEAGGLSMNQKESIMNRMCQMGHVFTYEALRQHLQKLIRQDKAAGGANDSSDNYIGARPGRLAELRPSDQRPTRRAGQKRLAPVYDDGEDDEEYKRPRKSARVKKEQVPRKMGQMEDDEPKPPKDDEEYWGESDQLQPSALFNSSLSLDDNNSDAEAPPVLADKAYPSDLLA
ncbi:hypothetical protein M434DRAFT_319093 [Hypoxylon sp. CO27-5]|nr:hypothetical protein M434DRAFT_319093 [Hypoxylon sp. CO27-5]